MAQTTIAQHGVSITAFEQSEWARMAQAAYRTGRNRVGHRMSAAAALPQGYLMPCRVYDGLAHAYRRWLIANEFPTD
jgi:hypothetical protein